MYEKPKTEAGKNATRNNYTMQPSKFKTTYNQKDNNFTKTSESIKAKWFSNSQTMASQNIYSTKNQNIPH